MKLIYLQTTITITTVHVHAFSAQIRYITLLYEKLSQDIFLPISLSPFSLFLSQTHKHMLAATHKKKKKNTKTFTQQAE
jgi:hypothetical protein